MNKNVIFSLGGVLVVLIAFVFLGLKGCAKTPVVITKDVPVSFDSV